MLNRLNNILFVQYANSIYPFEQCTKDYFDVFYGLNRSIGYKRELDSFEVPKWIAEISYIFKESRKEVYWIRGKEDVQRIGSYIKDNGFEHIMFSVMDCNKHWVYDTLKVIDTVKDNGVKAWIGGYGDYIKEYAEAFDFVTIVDSPYDLCQKCGAVYESGTDYSLFAGWRVLPRLTLSYGCLNHCDFCIVPKKIWEVPEEVIMQQIDSFKPLDFELIYLDDKTFGQAKNYTSLAKYTDYIRSYNPKFKGFVVQTTAAQCLKKDQMKTFAEIGVSVVEIGLETYNQDILDKYHKPLRLKMMDKLNAVAKEYGVYVLPNIIVGFEEETDESYQRTYGYLNKNWHCFIGINLSKYTDYGDADSLGEISFSNTPKKPLHEKWWLAFNKLGMGIVNGFHGIGAA